MGGLPGWVNLESEGTETSSKGGAGEGWTLRGVVTKWAREDGLGFLPEESIRDFVLGAGLVVDWDDDDDIAHVEDLLDQIWR